MGYERGGLRSGTEPGGAPDRQPEPQKRQTSTGEYFSRSGLQAYPHTATAGTDLATEKVKNKKDVNTDEVIEIIKKICDNFIDITNKEIQNGSININYPKNYLFLIISTCLFPFTTPYIIESVINMSMEEFYEKHYEYMKYILLKEIEILNILFQNVWLSQI